MQRVEIRYISLRPPPSPCLQRCVHDPVAFHSPIERRRIGFFQSSKINRCHSQLPSRFGHRFVMLFVRQQDQSEINRIINCRLVDHFFTFLSITDVSPFCSGNVQTSNGGWKPILIAKLTASSSEYALIILWPDFPYLMIYAFIAATPDTVYTSIAHRS